MKTPPSELLTSLRALRRPLIVGHVTPDADCIGASLGLAAAMRERNIAAEFALPGGVVAKRLDFMLHMGGREYICGGELGGHDAVIALDTAGANRLNAAFKFDALGGTPVLNIDHHVSNPGYGHVNWIDPHASSSGEMVHRLLMALGWPPSREVASLLYAGLHGDTAGFSLPNTTSDSLQAAADLVAAGADVGFIGEHLCRSQVRADFDLLRLVYDHTRVTPDGRIAYSHVTFADISGAGCNAQDIDDQVSIPRSLAGIKIALLFSEGEPGIVRINLRGEGRISVLPLAQQYGGGGHAQSAGVRVKNKPMQMVIDDVLAAAGRYLDGLKL